jgi:CRISPR-associated protein Cmr1
MNVVVFKLKGESRLYLGGYDTQFHEDDPFRTQSLKGLWRYWLRAYIAGAMYDGGILKCERRGKHVCEVSPNLLRRIAEKTGCLLGSLNSASKFRIVVEEAHAEFREDGFGAQRVKLLSLGRRRTSYGGNAYAKIRVEKSPHVKELGEDEIKLAIGSLLTAFSLNGLGKGGRRGLGTFSIEANGFEGKFLRDGKMDYGMIRELIGETLRSARSYLNLERGNPSEVPPIDCISEARMDLSGMSGSTDLFDKKRAPVFTVMRAKPRNRKDVDTMVVELQDFFYRPGRLRIMKIRENQDAIIRDKLAWFFGLPRRRGETGYLGAERRASPIHLAVHREEALFTFFLSGDWPTEIEWRGGRSISLRTDLEVKEAKVKEAYLTSISSLEGYLNRIGYDVEVIYP